MDKMTSRGRKLHDGEMVSSLLVEDSESVQFILYSSKLIYVIVNRFDVGGKTIHIRVSFFKMLAFIY